jgi:hypothetical protein
MWLGTFGFHKMPGNYQVATQLVASRVVLSSIELVIVLCTITNNSKELLEKLVFQLLKTFPAFYRTLSSSSSS